MTHARTIARRLAYVLALIGTVFIGMALAQYAKAGVRWPTDEERARTERQLLYPKPLWQLIEAAQLIEAENAKSEANQTKR